MTPLTRTADPDTSHEAAVDAEKNRQWTRLAVMEALWVLGQATDEEIAEVAHHFSQQFSFSGLRTRRCEMVRSGIVRQLRWDNLHVGVERKTRSGCWAKVWELTPNGGDE